MAGLGELARLLEHALEHGLQVELGHDGPADLDHTTQTTFFEHGASLPIASHAQPWQRENYGHVIGVVPPAGSAGGDLGCGP